MRGREPIFTPDETRAVLWIVVMALVLCGLGLVWDRAYGPSLGAYEQIGVSAPLTGVIEATPLN